MPPEFCYTNTQSLVYEPLDLSKDFTPFSGQPKFNDAFYLASNEAFSRPGASVEINFRLSENPNLPAPEGSEDLILAWEYWNGRQWEAAGQSSSRVQEEPEGPNAFLDTTAGLSQGGRVSFLAPENWAPCEVNQQKSYWLRARIHTGDFGVGGSYVQNEQGQWIWKFDRPLRPPFLSQISVKCILNAHTPQHVLVDNAHAVTEVSDRIRENEPRLTQKKMADPIDLFQAQKDRHPMCYFGFDQPFPAEENQLYFLLKDTPVLPSAAPGSKADRAPVSLAWEYWNGREWRDLAGLDQTLGLSRSGSLNFQGPKDFQVQSLWGYSLYWIRARYESGSYEQVPYLSKLLTHAVEAHSQRTISNEWLGSSDGAPDQKYSFAYCPVIGQPEIWVAENEQPTRDEVEKIRQAEGGDAIREEQATDGKRVWVRWHAVEGFYESGPGDRHYVLDANEGALFFGDGFHGRIPPEGPNNLLAARYCVGGGADSNVGVRTLTVMKKTIPGIGRVWNPVAAEGGADPESVAEAKRRAPHLFKHRLRAVTADDFEWLAKEASNQVARAKCLPAHRQEGEITVVIVPKAQPGQTPTDRLQPSRELLKRVHAYLDERRLLTTRLQVLGFRYRDISIQAEVVLKSSSGDALNVKARVEEKLRAFLHPLQGGPDQKGWPFGMAVSKSDLYMVLEKIEGIYYVAGVQIRDEDRGLEVDKLILPEDTFANPVAITVFEKITV